MVLHHVLRNLGQVTTSPVLNLPSRKSWSFLRSLALTQVQEHLGDLTPKY